MRLLIARPNYYSYSETFIEEQIRQLKPVDVLFEGLLPNRLKSGQSIYFFPLTILLFRGALRRLFPKLYSKIYTLFLKKYLSSNKIEAVLANYGPLAANIYRACIETNIPFSVVFLGFDASEKKTLDTYRQAYKDFLPKAKSVIIVSNSMRPILEEIAGPLDNIHFIPCGVDTQFFTPGNKESGFNVISVARFAEKKGPLNTIKAFELFLSKYQEAKLRMIGDGPLWEKAKQYVKAKNLGDRIEFLGPLNQNEYLPLLQKSNVFIQHSVVSSTGDSEGTPVAILEASACELAICSTFHAGIPDAVINGETGILVPEHDIVGMSEVLVTMAKNPGLTLEMGKSARKHIINNYDVYKLSNKIKNLLR